MRDAEDQIETMMLRGVQSRVTSALLKLAGRATGGAEVTISPVELSARVGLDVEAVKRTVQRLRDRQYVRIMGERIEIPDIDALPPPLHAAGHERRPRRSRDPLKLPALEATEARASSKRSCGSRTGPD